MSIPTEFDFAVIKKGNRAAPEVFAILCGVTDVTINRTVQSTDRFVPDCARPGAVPLRTTRITGKQMDVTGTGLTDVPSVTELEAALGRLDNYRIEGYRDNGTDAGELMGTFSGQFRLTALNNTIPRGGEAGTELTLASHGEWVWEEEE